MSIWPLFISHSKIWIKIEQFPNAKMKIHTCIDLSPHGGCLNCHIGVLLNMAQVSDTSEQFHNVHTATGLPGYNNMKYTEEVIFW